jgi:homocysteine S-methyltransferase
MNPIAVAKIIQDEVGIEAVPHLSCRDRNTIGLQSELLSAHALGVKNILAVTGDPVQIGDFPEAASVFDIDSVGLVHVLNQMNHGVDLAGNTIGEPPGFLIGASFNPTAEDMDSEIDKLKRKVEAGAHVFWTQPVFEAEALERAMEHVRDLNLTILLGMMPLRSVRQAEFLQNEVPGIEVPERIRRRLADLSKEDAKKYGVEVAQEVISSAYEITAGAYIMPPATAPELAAEVVEVLGDRRGQSSRDKHTSLGKEVQ